MTRRWDQFEPRDFSPPGPPANFDRRVDEIKSPPPGGGGVLSHPFQILDVSGPTTAKIRVRYGTVQDLEPDGVEEDITLAAGEWTVLLKVTVDVLGEITAAEIMTSDDGQPDNEEVPADVDVEQHSVVYLTLGKVIVTSEGGEEEEPTAVSVQVLQACTHSLRFRTCGRQQADPEAEPPIEFAPGTYHFWGF